MALPFALPRATGGLEGSQPHCGWVIGSFLQATGERFGGRVQHSMSGGGLQHSAIGKWRNSRIGVCVVRRWMWNRWPKHPTAVLLWHSRTSGICACSICVPIHAVLEPAGLPEMPQNMPTNAGIEALSTLDPFRFLALSEGLEVGGGYAGLLLAQKKARPLVYEAATGFRATGADRLGNLVLTLERRVGILSGWQALVRAVDARNPAGADGTIAPRTLAHLRPPLRLDNFEALAMRWRDVGEVAVALLSDDNFSPLQETLLLELMLDLPDGAQPAD